MEREQKNRQRSNNSSSDDSGSFSNNHQNSNDSVDSDSSSNNHYQNSNNGFDINSFLSNYQNSKNAVDIDHNLYQQLPNAFHPSSSALDSESLLQNIAVGLDRLSINRNDILQETEYPRFVPFLRNRVPRNGTIGSNSNKKKIPIGANRQPSINGGATTSNHSQRSSTANGFDYPQPDIGFGQNQIEFGGFLPECAMPIRGCIELQRMLNEGDLETKERIITKVMADLPLLMVHQIGFEFARTVFGSCSEEQMCRILQSVMLGDERLFVYICNDHYGKEAVKTLIENLKTDEQMTAVTYVLRNHICSFTNFVNSQQVLLFYIEASNHFNRALIFKEMGRYCINIATNRVGCVILQHLICTGQIIESNALQFLIISIVLSSPILSDDRYGNYVVQHVVVKGMDGATTRWVVRRLEGKISELSKSKYGSNVVEKCLEVGGEREVVRIVEELMNSTNLPSIAQNPFGNYVIQTALEQLHLRGMEGLYRNLVKCINVHASVLLTHMFGRTVMHKIRKLKQNSKPEKNSMPREKLPFSPF